MMALKLPSLLSFAVLANAHMAAFHKAMYCFNVSHTPPSVKLVDSSPHREPRQAR